MQLRDCSSPSAGVALNQGVPGWRMPKRPQPRPTRTGAPPAR